MLAQNVAVVAVRRLCTAHNPDLFVDVVEALLMTGVGLDKVSGGAAACRRCWRALTWRLLVSKVMSAQPDSCNLASLAVSKLKHRLHRERETLLSAIAITNDVELVLEYMWPHDLLQQLKAQ